MNTDTQDCARCGDPVEDAGDHADMTGHWPRRDEAEARAFERERQEREAWSWAESEATR